MQKLGLPQGPKQILCSDIAMKEKIIITGLDEHLHAVTFPSNIPDRRAKVCNAAEYPFNCVGIVLTYYKA